MNTAVSPPLAGSTPPKTLFSSQILSKTYLLTKFSMNDAPRLHLLPFTEVESPNARAKNSCRLVLQFSLLHLFRWLICVKSTTTSLIF